MFSWLFGYNNRDMLDKNIKTASNYVLFTKMKEFEERLEDLTNKVQQLIEDNKNLKNEVKRLRNNHMYLNNSHRDLNNILNECLILPPQSPKLIVGKK